jgi:hypothetical protein
MMRIVSLLGMAFMYFCLGTVLAQSALVFMLWQKGTFADQRMMNMWAALHGIESTKVAAQEKKGTESESKEQGSYDDIVTKRALASLDIDLRENAIDKSLGELKSVEAKIRTERTRFDSLVNSFDLKLQELESSATNQAVLETQQTLEALPTKQAKQQLLKLLEEKPSDRLTNPRESVVALVKAMPIERRKKILAEFKTEEEGDQLAEILKDILSGTPDVPILRQSKADLQKLTPDTK